MMIRQLSVFLENRSGRLTDVTAALAQSGINIVAQCVADTSDFGLLRMVVSNPDLAHGVLRERGFSVQLTDVLCLHLKNAPGALHAALAVLSGAGVSIDYMYAFGVGERAFVALRTADLERTAKLLLDQDQKLLRARDVGAG